MTYPQHMGISLGTEIGLLEKGLCGLYLSDSANNGQGAAPSPTLKNIHLNRALPSIWARAIRFHQQAFEMR